MTEDQIARQLCDVLNVMPSDFIPVEDLVAKWGGRSGSLVAAAIKLLGEIRNEIPDVVLKTRCNGVSGYGADRVNGRCRECFHVGVNVRPIAMVFCQHGNATDGDGFFNEIRQGYMRGYLQEEADNRAECLLYVTGVLRESYRRITGN